VPVAQRQGAGVIREPRLLSAAMFSTSFVRLRIRVLFLVLSALLTLFPPAIWAQASQGVARAWGTYQHYDSVSGDFTSYPMAAPAGLSNVVALASGVRHVVALRANGSVVSWGEWEWGMTNVPPTLTQAAAIAAGDYHALALTPEGRVVAWGTDFSGQLNVPAPVTNAVIIGAGGFHSLALTASGQVYGWGRNRNGQCNPPPGLSNNVVALTGGLEHSVALLRDGRVVAWGDNSAGQTNVPATVTNIIALAARNNYTLALRADGMVLGWGTNANNLTNIPGTVTRALAVAAGENHCVALLTNRAIVAWGNNSGGQTTIPAGTTNVTSIAAGTLHSAAALGPVPLVILAPPQNVTVFAGQAAALKVAALGAPAPAYQWRRAGVNLAGGTNAVLTLPAAQFADAGDYDVVVTNLSGRVTSAVARLEVTVPVTTARFLLEDRSTRGNWKGVYGTQAYAVFGQATNFPGGTALAVSHAAYYPFATNTPDPRALEHANQANPSNRISACVYAADAMTFDLALPVGPTNRIALYLMEPGGGRTERVELIRPDTGAVLDTRVVPALSNGVYLMWEVTGPVRARVSRVAGANAVVSGVFVGSPAFQAPTLRYTSPSSTNLVGDRLVLVLGANGSPALHYQWRHGGLNLTNTPTRTGVREPVLELKDYTVADAGDYSVLVSNFFGWTTSGVVRLRVPGTVATAQFVTEDRGTRGNWPGVYGTAGSVVFGLQTNLPPELAAGVVTGPLYLFTSNSPSADALENPAAPSPTNRFSACLFSAGEILLDVPVPVGENQRVALYVMEPGGGRVQRVEVLDTASGLPLDTRTVGSLTNGAYLVWDVNGPVQLRITRVSGANAVVSGLFFGTASGQAPVVRAPPASQSVTAGATVALGVGANGSPALSWQWRRNGLPLADAAGRSGSASPVLQMRPFQAADTGDYTVVISNALGRATSIVARVEAVVGVPLARWRFEDRTTRGNWKGVYGTGGYVLFGLATNLNFTASDAPFYPFSTNTPDARALERPGAASPTNRFSACVFTAGAMTFDVPLPAGQTNQLGIYLMEPGGGRVQRVDVLDPATSFVLDTRTVAGLSNGVHLQWEVTGSVRLRVTRIAGANAVASALFVGTASGQAPVVTVPPVGGLVVSGGSVALGVSASGAPALGWQWRRNGQALADNSSRAGSQQPVLRLSQLQSQDAGNYSVVVTNHLGAVTSLVATVEFAPGNGSWLTGINHGPGGGVTLHLTGVPGQTYVTQAATSLAPAHWVNVSTNQAGSDGSFVVTDPAAVGLPQRFYRTAQP
jgi:hypothetical protein